MGGSALDEEAVLALPGCSDGFDVVIGCDVVLAGWDTTELLDSCARLLRKDLSSRFLLGFEFREDWETIGSLLDNAGTKGLQPTFTNLLENGQEAEDDDDEDEFFLYKLSWKPDEARALSACEADVE